MSSAWDRFQERIKDKIRENFSEGVVDHSFNPRNVGSINNANGYAKIIGSCGDTMEIWLRVDGDTIINAGFRTTGCGTTIASGSMITEMVKGKYVNESLKIGQQDVLDALGGLPEESEHCALLASNALKAAINNFARKNDQS